MVGLHVHLKESCFMPTRHEFSSGTERRGLVFGEAGEGRGETDGGEREESKRGKRARKGEGGERDRQVGQLMMLF